MNFETPTNELEIIDPENNLTSPTVQRLEVRHAELDFIADPRERRIAQFCDSFMSILRK